MFYSKSTGGFYTLDIHTNIPSDAIEISDEIHQSLLEGQMDSQRIVADKEGHPVLEDNPEPTYVEKRRAEYPLITDYLDGIVKNDQAQIDAYITACQIVKAKYPKE